MNGASDRATNRPSSKGARLGQNAARASCHSEGAERPRNLDPQRAGARFLASLGTTARRRAALSLAAIAFAASVTLALGVVRTAVGQTQATEQTPEADTQPAIRFTAVDVFIDSGKTPLAAYQFELSATAGEIKVVGVEGGEHPAFGEPPYYDPKALQNDRIIIAAFNTGTDLPAGKTRVARVHLAVIGPAEPEYAVKLHVAATADGKTIPATASVVQGEVK